jgi:DNA-binding SARP family transcriptional activator
MGSPPPTHGPLTTSRCRLVIGSRTRYNRGVLEFRILGPLEVAGDDAEPLALGGQRQRAVLALLLLNANRVVSTDRLLDALWGEEPPRTARTSLQNAISALRGVLGGDVLRTQAPGYRLVVDPEDFDLGRFELLVGSARTLAGAERAERLREALGLWRGDALADFAYDSFAGTDTMRLAELRLGTLEDRIDADLACERYGELVPELEALVAEHSFRERLVGQLMLALYHSGRQNDALARYEQLRRALADVSGQPPRPELQELHLRILRQQVPRPQRTDAIADDAHFEEVAAALLAGRLVPVLGSDVRVIAQHLAHRFEYTEDPDDLTRVAQFVALTKGPGPLHDELQGLLQTSGSPTPVHRFFAALPRLLRERELPHQLLVTTGYDLAPEQALLDADEEFDIVAYVASGRDRGRFCHRDPSGQTRIIDLPNTYASELSLDRRTVVLKLHGGLREAGTPDHERVVVTEDDYIGYLSQGDVGSAVPIALAAKLRRSHFLFLGYGMREWSLRLVLDRVSGGQLLAYRSWAIVPAVRPLERQLWLSRDVELLEQPLETYVDGLGQHVGLSQAGATA